MHTNLSEEVTSWNREQLIDYLICYGIEEDLEQQETEELRSLLLSLVATIPTTQNEAIAEEIIVESIDPMADLSFENDESMTLPTILPLNNANLDIENITNMSSDHHLSEEEQMNRVLSLCEVTGMEYDDAQTALISQNWNVSTAMSIYFNRSDGDTAVVTDVTIPSVRSRALSTVGVQNDENSSNITGEAVPVTEINRLWENVRNEIRDMASDNDDENDYFSYGGLESPLEVPRRTDKYDDDGIRLPDPVRQQRLMSTGYTRRMMDNPLDRADAEGVEWLHPPASHLSIPFSFSDAKSMSKTEKKWLIVNIQSHESFASHMLNRDTWSDETIESIIRSNYYFWQRGHTSKDGQNFMRAYQLKDSDLPCICIIDCRTGSRVLHIKGNISPIDLLVVLMEFIETYSFDSADAPVFKQIDATVWSDVGKAAEPSDLLTPSNDHENDNLNHDEIIYETESILEDSVAEGIFYGPVPAEPDASEDCIKVSIKLATGGKPIVRRFLSSNTVKELHAFVDSIRTDSGPFELLTSFPTKSLSDNLDITLADASVAGSQIIVRRM